MRSIKISAILEGFADYISICSTVNCVFIFANKAIINDINVLVLNMTKGVSYGKGSWHAIVVEARALTKKIMSYMCNINIIYVKQYVT
jgi:hypothetical protein